MKSISILFYFLILQIGIKADSSSLSFINLISNLISNGRFIQENLISSYIEFNQTLPLINLNSQFDANQSNCSQHIQLLVDDLINRKTWALKTLDAWGKFPSGIMQGNLYWIGSVYECKHHLRGFNNTVIEQPFQTRTCVIKNDDLNQIRPVYGLCMPQTCNENDIVNYINQRIIQIPYLQEFLQITNDSIQCIENRSYDRTAILTILLLFIITFLILIATGVHMKYGRNVDPNIVETSATTHETAVIETTATTNIVTTTVQTEDENTPLIAQPSQSNDFSAQKLINSCSIVNNVRILKEKSEPRNLACLNGIRVLSLCWVILGHTFLIAAYYSDNVMTIFNWFRLIWFQIIVQAVFSIDSFFLLSGLLTSFLFLMTRIENERFSIVKFLVHHYIYRYLRYTIFYGIILLIYITLSPYLGQDGPIYPKNGIETLSCRQTWWRNLLYINNFFDISDSCMPITWFLAVNMQFHWIAPLFLLAVYWKWIVGMLVASAFIIVDIVTTSVLVSKYNYDHGIFSDFYLNRSNSTHNYMNDIYIKPWCRISPYAIGLLLGYTLYDIHQRANTLSWESLVPRQRSYRIKHILARIFALILFGLCIFGTYGDYNGHFLTRAGRITFLTLSRIGWAIGLSIIIISCYVGRKGLINKFLSHRFFEFLSKLTFGAYLWHVLVLSINYLARDQPNHYTIANILFNCIIHIILSYTLSFITYILIELPIIQLLKLCFKRPTIKQ